MAATYKVNKEILAWAIESSGNDPRFLEKKFPKIEDWLKESSQIPIGQLQELSKTLTIPFGYFFLNEIPQEEIPLANYRTIDNEHYHQLSRNLIETIYEMERKQEFVRRSRIEDGFDPLPFIGRFDQSDDFMAIADDIREVLQLTIDWNQTAEHPYNYLRSFLNKVGILVFKNGIVKANTHRNLNLEEFRAFVLMDEYAPLIFINAKDSLTAQLFSLCHEMAHIWLGEPELLNTYNQKFYDDVEDKELERLCNQVAAELLLPSSQINKLFNQEYEASKIQIVARKLGVSPQVVVIKLRQDGHLSRKKFEKFYEQLVEASKKNLEKKTRSSNDGGDFYVTSSSRLDHSFVELVNRKAQTGALLYTDAFDLLNVKSGKTYDNLVRRIEVQYG